MKIETTEGTLELKGLKGSHIDKIWGYLTNIYKDGEEDLKLFQEYMDYLNKTAAEICGKTDAEFKDMDIEDSEKVIAYISDKVNNRLGFMKPSQSRGH